MASWLGWLICRPVHPCCPRKIHVKMANKIAAISDGLRFLMLCLLFMTFDFFAMEDELLPDSIPVIPPDHPELTP